MEQSLDKFEGTTKKLAIDTLVQNFLSFDQIMNDENIITMAPSQDYKPLGLFQDQSNKKCNYPTFFLDCLENLQF
jgi:hypothetical protein